MHVHSFSSLAVHLICMRIIHFVAQCFGFIQILYDVRSNMYKTLAGNVTNLSCDTPNNQQLYFRKEAFRVETSRRSLTISDIPLHNTAALCTIEGITGERLHITCVCGTCIFVSVCFNSSYNYNSKLV